MQREIGQGIIDLELGSAEEDPDLTERIHASDLGRGCVSSEIRSILQKHNLSAPIRRGSCSEAGRPCLAAESGDPFHSPFRLKCKSGSHSHILAAKRFAPLNSKKIESVQVEFAPLIDVCAESVLIPRTRSPSWWTVPKGLLVGVSELFCPFAQRPECG